MADIDAFTLLEELTGLQVILKEAEANEGSLSNIKKKYEMLSQQLSLARLRSVFRETAAMMDDLMLGLSKMKKAVREERVILVEKLKTINVKEEDLDEIRKRREQEAKQPPPTPPTQTYIHTTFGYGGGGTSSTIGV